MQTSKLSKYRWGENECSRQNLKRSTASKEIKREADDLFLSLKAKIVLGIKTRADCQWLNNARLELQKQITVTEPLISLPFFFYHAIEETQFQQIHDNTASRRTVDKSRCPICLQKSYLFALNITGRNFSKHYCENGLQQASAFSVMHNKCNSFTCSP